MPASADCAARWLGATGAGGARRSSGGLTSCEGVAAVDPERSWSRGPLKLCWCERGPGCTTSGYFCSLRSQGRGCLGLGAGTCVGFGAHFRCGGLG